MNLRQVCDLTYEVATHHGMLPKGKTHDGILNWWVSRRTDAVGSAVRHRQLLRIREDLVGIGWEIAAGSPDRNHYDLTYGDDLHLQVYTKKLSHWEFQILVTRKSDRQGVDVFL